MFRIVKFAVQELDGHERKPPCGDLGIGPKDGGRPDPGGNPLIVILSGVKSRAAIGPVLVVATFRLNQGFDLFGVKLDDTEGVRQSQMISAAIYQ